MSALLRDFEARAIADLPMTVKVVRPGGTETYDRTIVGDDVGGYLFEILLSGAARAGSWTATAYVGERPAPVGSTSSTPATRNVATVCTVSWAASSMVGWPIS